MTDVQVYICDSCIKKGIYNIENIKGFGIFKDELNENELIINTAKIWGTSKEFKKERVWGRTVFNNEKDLFFNEGQDLPTNSDIKKLYDILSGWNWERGDQDIKMVTGWVLCATLAGAVNWRTHASLTGGRGTGKSTFLEYFLNKILGQFSMLADGGSSEAGIRQNVGNSSCAVLLDESESDGKRLSSILTMLRSSSSGSTLLRGTADQKAKNYSLKIAGFLAGIVPPDLNAADASRFLVLSLKPARAGARAPIEIYDEKFMKNLGLKLVAFIVKYFKDFLEIKEKVTKIMLLGGADGRYCETNAPLVASSFMLYNLFSNETSENDIFDNEQCKLRDFDEVEFMQFISKFDFKKEIDNNNKKDEEELLNYIFSSKLSSESIRQDCVSNHLLAAIGLYDYNEEEKGYKVNKKDVKKLLGLSGIAIKEEKGLNYVYIDTTDFNFRKMIKETKFEKGNLVAVLKRHKHSVEIEEEKTHISINNSKRAKGKVVKILLDLILYLLRLI